MEMEDASCLLINESFVLEADDERSEQSVGGVASWKMEEVSSPLINESFVLEAEDESSIAGSGTSISHLTLSSEDSLPDRLSPLLNSPEVESPLPHGQAKAAGVSNAQKPRHLSSGAAQQAKLLFAERYTSLCYVRREGSSWGGIVK